jgi:hypothetical protein
MPTHGQIVAAHLDTLNVPEPLKQQVVYRDSGPWPPRPGCAASPDIALGRMWARIDLAQWVAEAPQAFGPHRNGELDGLAAIGTRRRYAGEGTLILWGINVVRTEQWVAHDSTGLAVVELICLGPYLPDSLVDEIDTALSGIGWAYPTDTEANRPCTVNYTPCFHTAWHEGYTLSAHPNSTGQFRAE